MKVMCVDCKWWKDFGEMTFVTRDGRLETVCKNGCDEESEQALEDERLFKVSQ